MKGNSYFYHLILLVFLIHCGYVAADLPIHCLKSQVVGKWILKQGKVLPPNSSHEQLACGHTFPDNESTSNLSMGGLLTEIDNEIEVTLTSDFKVSGNNGESGSWTLVYDEGWEINYMGTKYTHFFKYFQENGRYKSDCSQTLVGWFNHNLSQRGCSQAFKADASTASVSNSLSQAHVVQPKTAPELIEKKSPSSKCNLRKDSL